MYVSLKAAVRGQIRNAEFEGRSYVVVPVVALVEGVIHAVNSKTPELVLAEEFAKVPDGWNGRPVTWDHPNLNGQQVSANEPMVLEKMGIGQIFHSKVEDKKLEVEAWIDTSDKPQTARALESVERVKAGKTVEVSVGAFVQTEEKTGEYNGTPYAGIWREIVPDHLAFLPDGKTGACSVEMGCGAPRAAEEDKKMTVKERFLEFMNKFRPSQSEDTSDAELREALDRALRAVEPGYLGIDAVFPDAAQVVYVVAPEDTLVTFRRDYTVGDGGEITIGKDAEEVRPVMRYEPVNASAAPADGGAANTPPAGIKEEVDMEKKDRVAAIIASGKTCFTEADEAHMMSFDEERLTALEAHVTTASKPPEPKPEPKQFTPEEEQAAFLEKHPDIALIVSEHKAAATAKRDGLVSELKTSQKTFTEEELQKMDVSQLEKLATLTKEKPDYSGQTPRAATDGDDAAPAPIDMGERIRTARSA